MHAQFAASELKMELSPETFKSALKIIGAREPLVTKLNEDQAAESLAFIKGSNGISDVQKCVLVIQALILSGYAKPTAQAIIDTLNPETLPLTNSVYQLAASLEVALLETFREADSLVFDRAEGYLSHIKSLPFEDRAAIQQKSGWIQAVVINLLNTWHQEASAEIIIDFLENLNELNFNSISAASLTQNILRKSFVPQRLNLRPDLIGSVAQIG